MAWENKTTRRASFKKTRNGIWQANVWPRWPCRKAMETVIKKPKRKSLENIVMDQEYSIIFRRRKTREIPFMIAGKGADHVEPYEIKAHTENCIARAGKGVKKTMVLHGKKGA